MINLFVFLLKLVKYMEINDNPSLTWAEFEKVDMRVGTVLEAEVYAEARNPSYKLLIDFGPMGTKRSSAQITVLYKPEDLIGTQVIAVTNFPPKQIGKFMSECLVLGVVNDEKIVTLLRPSHPTVNGDRIA
jgi:tRNA-binding protein